MKKLALLAVLIFLLVPSTDAANARVQNKSAQQTNGAPASSIVVTPDSSLTTGNLVAVYVIWGDVAKTTTIADGACGNTYTSVEADAAARSEVWLAKNITGGACAITATFSASITAFHTIIMHEVSGAHLTAPLGQNTHQSQTGIQGTDSVSSTAVTTTTNGEYIFGITVRTDAIGAGAFSAGTGFTVRENNGGGTYLTTMSEEQIQTSAGSIAATFTPPFILNASTTIVTIKAASGAASAARRRILN